MAKVKFFTQKMIEQWVALGRAEFNGRILTVKSSGEAYELDPATMFKTVIEGKDRQKLIGKVLTEKHVQDLGIDVYLDSAILGEIAYRVEPGFIVAKLVRPAAQAAAAGPSGSQGETKPIQDLADLMVKALSE